jgi:thiosulfate/3-mercaptopyruvate sulfurtransferase
MNKLVETKWLAEHLNDSDLMIVDASPTEEYMRRHIKNAVSASFAPDEYLSDGINTSYGGGIDLFTDPDSSIPWVDGPLEYIGEAIRSLGINQNLTIVVYDQGADFLATRFFWTLTFHGHEKVFILNGGLSKWAAEGLPLTTERAQVKKGDFIPSVTEQNIVVSTNYVLKNLYNPQLILVDANRSSWYYGSELVYSKRGHIPNAVNVPFTMYFQDDKTWKTVSELKNLFVCLGIVPEKEVIAYCGGSIAGSCLYFTLRFVLGYPKVKFYRSAFVGWLSDPRGLPVHTYANEHLLRDAEWLRWFGGERIQYLVRDPKVRIIDVSPRGQYQAGHIPYAVNIPVDELVNHSNLNQSDWEDLFGSNGIGDDMEVVIYDDGLNLYSALFFWLMEYFGHTKVSILKGGLALWIEKGFNVTTRKTIIAKPKHKFDVAICPTSYRIKPQKQKRFIEGENDNTFPKVWLVSSSIAQSVPRVFQNENKVLIPWKNNLDEKGRIKSAGELASIYEGAGIYKTCQIICFSESLFEATFTYFILRLLGYPMIKLFKPSKRVSGML